MEHRFLVRPGTDLLGPDRWEEVFGGPGLLEVEIGFGKDEFLLALAERHPSRHFLAIDFSRPRTRSYLRKIEMRGLENVRVLFEHAANALGLCLEDGSVREFYVLFPDPWPKKRHARHRLVSPWFAREVARVLVPGGRITFSTDQAPYRDQVLMVMEAHGGFRNLLAPPGYGERPEEFDATIFERRWARLGREVHYMQFSAKGDDR